jgi:hypothetical protein
MAASFPTVYLKSGLSEVPACRITFATSDGCIAFCDHCLKYSDILFSIDLYGELRGSEAFVAIFKFFKKFEPTPPGSITMTLIPNGSSSYCIDSDRQNIQVFICCEVDGCTKWHKNKDVIQLVRF